MLLSGLTPSVTKLPVHPEGVFPLGPFLPPTMDHLDSVWFYTLNVLQAKPRCLLHELSP
jgi:hypothetical protein